MLGDNIDAINGKGLVALETRVKEDLAYLCYTGKDWVPQRVDVSDVVIIGGGMCGMVAWMGLTSSQITNVRILDRNPKGFEGPWLNYARMETLRSPKQLTGPAFGHGALTFQAWYRAQFGAAKWEALVKIPRPMWMDYLRWYRSVLNIPIENGVSVERVEPEGDLLRLHLSGADKPSILTRKLVFATGRDGTGTPNIPDFVRGLPRHRWAHSSDDIDFGALKAKRVAVVGVGASAVDNAAEALEHGATEVRHLIRREKMPTVNKMMGIASYGFTVGFGELPDEWRWRFMQYSFATQTPPPHGSTKRVSRHSNAYFHFGKGVSDVTEEGDALRVSFTDGTSYSTDFLILGTGFKVDPMARKEFGDTADDILLWQNVYTPPQDEQNNDLGCFPYLNSDLSFREKSVGRAPWLGSIYCFNFGATASLGKISGDIPGVSDGATLLARSIAATLYAEDVKIHWQDLVDYETPELLGDEWEPSVLDVADAKGQVA
jgi:cation diffusion facilitator CzcD-associated flavoprotein CzcO